MKKTLPLLMISLIFLSCIPYQVAPTIPDYKIKKGKTFKSGLPERQVFLFEDPKVTSGFYDYVNTKYSLHDYKVYDDVPFSIDDEQFFFSFYECSKANRTVNFLPTLFDATLQAVLTNELGDVTGPSEMRSDKYYIAIEVYSDTEYDCLSEKALSRPKVLTYLRDLKREYLATDNYNELLFKDEGL